MMMDAEMLWMKEWQDPEEAASSPNTDTNTNTETNMNILY